MKKCVMKSDPGTYILVFHCLINEPLTVGKWGKIVLQPGYYLYVGSAFGPGGIKARIMRHHRAGKAKHWHIDYLREHMQLVSAWYSYDRRKLEHLWAQSLTGFPDMQAIRGFGCTDCQCYSHLFRTDNEPLFQSFSNKAAGLLEKYSFTAA